MLKNINLGAIHISTWNPKKRKMFSWDFYYGVNDDFYCELYKKQVKECDPKEVVLIPKQEYTLVIDYPTSHPYKAKLQTGKKGITRIQLADKICKHYKKMYDDKSKYGIWGHDIGDLILCNAIVKKNGEIHLGVDS